MWSDIFNERAGVLYWKIRPALCVNKGDAAGNLDNKGYVRIQYSGVRYLRGRIIWEMYNGEIPPGMEIDHKDGNSQNDKLSNLRLVTHVVNSKNRSIRSDNTTGATGVYFHKPSGRWRARITINGVKRHLGMFDTIEDAKAARDSIKMRYDYTQRHGEDNNGN